MKCWVGIDNGVTGSVGIIDENGFYAWFKTPTISEQSYTKKVQKITRIRTGLLRTKLLDYLKPSRQVIILIERPYVNPLGFKATASALRALEATLIVIETLGLPYEYVDSKAWQKALLPAGIKGPDLKKASLDIGKRYFPDMASSFGKDADGLLIALYNKRRDIGELAS